MKMRAIVIILIFSTILILLIIFFLSSIDYFDYYFLSPDYAFQITASLRLSARLR
jgi:hypothetical protein